MSAKELPTPEEMQEMAEVDLKNIDTSNLIDIEQGKKKKGSCHRRNGLQTIFIRLRTHIVIFLMGWQ